MRVEKLVARQQGELADLEFYLKRHQVEVIGIPELAEERTKKMICELFEKRVKISCDEVLVESASRLGFGRDRNILVNFKYLKDREKILESSWRLNGTKYDVIEH